MAYSFVFQQVSSLAAGSSVFAANLGSLKGGCRHARFWYPFSDGV